MLLSLKLSRLYEILRDLGPVVGVDGTVGEVVVKFDPQPTAQQQSDVDSAIAAFDWSDAADEAWLENLNPERKALRDQATAAIARLDQIIAASSATQQQAYNAVKDIALYTKHIINRLIQIE